MVKLERSPSSDLTVSYTVLRLTSVSFLRFEITASLFTMNPLSMDAWLCESVSSNLNTFHRAEVLSCHWCNHRGRCLLFLYCSWNWNHSPSSQTEGSFCTVPAGHLLQNWLSILLQSVWLVQLQMPCCTLLELQPSFGIQAKETSDKFVLQGLLSKTL